MQIQMDMMKGLKALGDSVQPVLFTDEPFYQHLCDVSDGALLCSSNFESNSYHMPYVRSFIQALESLPISCSFYGYVNGDILISPSITDVLRTLQSSLRQAVTEKPFLVVGRRTNYPWKNVTTLPIHVGYANQLDAMCSSDAPYMSNAIVWQARTDHA